MPEATGRDGVHGLPLPVRARSREIWSETGNVQGWDAEGHGEKGGERGTEVGRGLSCPGAGAGTPQSWVQKAELGTGRKGVTRGVVSLLWDEPAEGVGDLSDSSGGEWVIW